MNSMPITVMIGVILAAVSLLVALLGIRYIPNKRVGIVEKRWSTKGSVEAGLIALNDEAGFQPAVLRGGVHWLMPFQYKVHILPLVTIPQGKIGYVFARDGLPLAATQTLAGNTQADNFEDTPAFLRNGGQRGPQRKILREGTYAINLETYARQEKAAVKERELREAEARARQQQRLTESEISITIQGNEGKAEYQRALQDAAKVRALAEADAEKAARIGIGQAIAIDEQVRAYGGPQFQLTQQVMNRFAEAIEESRVDVVPKILIGNQGGNDNQGTGSVLEALLTLLLSEKLGEKLPLRENSARNPQAEAMRNQIRQRLETGKEASEKPSKPVQ